MRRSQDLLTEWQQAYLPDIAEIKMGQSPESAHVNENGEGMVFYQGKAEFGKLHPVPKKYCTEPKKIAVENDVLLSVRAPVGPTNLASQTTAIGRGLAALKAYEGVDYRFLLYFFRSIEPWLSEQGTGTTFKAISGKFLKELPVVVPSTAEQKQIVAKLDELLAQVDSIKIRLDAIPAILKRFRQSVLTAAVSGRLTEDWRKSHQSSARELAKELTSIHAKIKKRSNSAAPTVEAHTLTQEDIPQSWEIIPLEYCCEPDRPITYGILKPGPDTNGGVPYIKVRDFPNDQLIDSGFKRTTNEIDGKYQRSKLDEGDLLVSIRGTVGRLVRIPERLNGANITQDSARISIKRGGLAQYVLWYLRSPPVQYRMNRAQKGVAVKGINIGDVRALQVALPPLEEQIEIVKRVELYLTLAEQISIRLNSAQVMVNNLTQSTLAKAFRGELTAEWREQNLDLITGENSAEALLERIEAAASLSKPAKKRRKKTVA